MEYYTHHPIKLQEIYKKVKKQIQVLDLQLPHIKDTAQPIQKQINEISANEIIQIIAREFSFSNIENQSIMESINVKSRIGLLIKLLQNSLFSDNKSLH